MTMNTKKPVKYFVVDAFTDTAFKGNQAVVCFLEDEHKRDDSWFQSLAAEFNLPMTCFLTNITSSNLVDPPCFMIRWFTRSVEMDICGHATLASAHTLFSNGLVGSSDTIEFATHSGILIARKVPGVKEESFSIELSLPLIQSCEYNSNDVSIFSKALGGATIVDIKGTTTSCIDSEALNGVAKAASTDKIIVVLPSWDSVTELKPRTEDILKCPGKMLIVTAAAPQGSSYDFITRVFGPKIGVDESPVCGSGHCALAHYWSLKMNKCDFLAYAASPRSGIVKLHYDEEKKRVLLTGKSVTVMEGSVFV